ncbi:MAG: DUF4293 domain-containing protein [Bacteroidota bacterium]
MIQRVQTLYLFGTIVACIAMLFFPFAGYSNPDRGLYLLTANGIQYVNEHVTVNFWLTFPILMINSLTIVLSALSIFMFKKRRIQLWFVNISFLLTVILIMLLFFYYTGYVEKLANAVTSYRLGIAFPLVSLVSLVMASRAIRKDEALVKSVDRLR